MTPEERELVLRRLEASTPPPAFLRDRRPVLTAEAYRLLIAQRNAGGGDRAKELCAVLIRRRQIDRELWRALRSWQRRWGCVRLAYLRGLARPQGPAGGRRRDKRTAKAAKASRKRNRA